MCDDRIIRRFAGVFLPYMLAADGKPMLEHIAASNLLPPPSGEPS